MLRLNSTTHRTSFVITHKFHNRSHVSVITFNLALYKVSLVLKKHLNILQSSPNCRVVTWYMGSELKAQNMSGIRAQRKGLRAQRNGIRDHKAFEPESGIRFITRSKNLLLQYFSA